MSDKDVFTKEQIEEIFARVDKRGWLINEENLSPDEIAHYKKWKADLKANFNKYFLEQLERAYNRVNKTKG